MILKPKKELEQGFTLMEIVVATTLFVTVFMALLSLFNYTLKINRRTEALRQASQGMRNFIEYLVKEVRNGQIDYFVSGGQTYTSGVGPCKPNGYVAGDAVALGQPAPYSAQSNWLGIINTDGVQECFYYGDDTQPIPQYVGDGVFSAPSGHNYNLIMEKAGLIAPVAGVQVLNPSNFNVDNLMFVVRPTTDPYSKTYTGSYPKIPPVVSIFIKFTTKLPTGEQVPIYYQTSVTTNQYDIPNQ